MQAFTTLIQKLFLIVAATLPVSLCLAQDLRITPDKLSNEENVTIDGWVAHLEQPGSFVEDKLTDFAKSTFNLRPEKRTKSIWVFPKVQLKGVMPLRGDLRAVIMPSEESTTVGFTFSPGYDIHLTKEKYPKELASLEGWVKQYVKYHYTEFYKEQTVKKEKELKSKQTELEREEKKLSKLKETLAASEAKADAGDDKATAKNEKSKTAIADVESVVEKINGEITEIESAITAINESQKKVDALK